MSVSLTTQDNRLPGGMTFVNKESEAVNVRSEKLRGIYNTCKTFLANSLNWNVDGL
jgi:hypothetical protein